MLIDMNLQSIDAKGFKKILRQKGALRAHENFKKVASDLLMRDLYAARFEDEETIVSMGRIVTEVASRCEHLTYAEVPLGIIVSGKVVVFENGKAVRHLTVGDFIGLFETAHYLHFQSKKRLGNWTLLSEGETKVVFLGHDSFDHTLTESKQSLEHHLIRLSRNDRTPKPLTELPLLDRFVHLHDLPLKEDVLIIAHTHVLTSSYALFRHLAAVVGYQNIFIMDKPYSTIPAVADRVVEMGAELIRVTMKRGLAYEFSVQDSIRVLWDRVLAHTKRVRISKIVIIDDGADILSNIPWQELAGIEVVGVEQTTRGVNRIREGYATYPAVVNVAGSAVKKEIESDFIARAIVDELMTVLGDARGNRVGVVGMGNIGKRIIAECESVGISVKHYDFSKFNSMSPSRNGNTSSISEIIEKNDIIVGATGRDFLRGVVLDKSSGEKHLLSASSADVEFYSMLNRAGFPSDAFETIVFRPHADLAFHIHNGGFPVNFNRVREVESADDMQLTRALLFAGIVEAMHITRKENKPILYRLDTGFQREIVNIWIALDTTGERKALPDTQIERLSDGERQESAKTIGEYVLHETTSPYLDIVRQHNEPYTTKVFGKELLVFPEVMSPKYDWAGTFGVETLPDVHGKTVLELGCGSGIIALFAALRGARSVDAVDINPHALENTAENFRRHDIENARVLYSDLFSATPGRYDVVIFNLPYHGNAPRDILEYGVADEHYAMMKRFIAELPDHMNDDGIADVGFSTSGDTPLLLEQFKKNGLEIIEKYSDERFGYNCEAYILRKGSVAGTEK